MTLSNEEKIRYGRQLIIPEIGEAGQEKLKAAKVFIAGLGGLGSVSAYYMAAAGVGYLRIADKDSVEPGNLNRQILHGTGDIGKSKTESAREKLRNLNPHCRIDAVCAEIRDDNIAELVGDCALIIDGTDNPDTRKILNRVHLSNHIPFVFAGIEGFDGMATTFVPGETPCFECLFPGKRKKNEGIPVVAPAAGLLASIQSMEALKLITGISGGLKGRLLYIRGREMTFREIEVKKNPVCKACSH